MDEAKREYHRKYQAKRVASFKGMELPGGVEHNTVNAYANYACRCAACKTAYREYQIPQSVDRKANGLPEGDARHGTYNGYANWGCRCEACVEANRKYAIDYRLRTGKISTHTAEALMGR